jgi:hypothetical protein
MKTFIRIFSVVILLASCTQPKIQLRAPVAAETGKSVKTDSVKKDSVILNAKQLAD